MVLGLVEYLASTSSTIRSYSIRPFLMDVYEKQQESVPAAAGGIQVTEPSWVAELHEFFRDGNRLAKLSLY